MRKVGTIIGPDYMVTTEPQRYTEGLQQSTGLKGSAAANQTHESPM